MAQYYRTVADYAATARSQLQDLVGPPYRYSDDDIANALNQALAEMGRIRPDIFLDLKYMQPLRKGDLNEGMPALYTAADIAVATAVPVPAKYTTAVSWFVNGWLQLYDVADTTDARGQAFMTKFQTQLMTLSAA